jgi:hypothetical protein
MPNYTQPNIPDGLKTLVLRVLEFHQGRDAAIGRNDLVRILRLRGQTAHERLVRECIKVLRRDGHLICAMPGTDGGYYIASTLQEFEEFDRAEFGAKIADMNTTRQAMLESARKKYGDGVQLELTL